MLVGGPRIALETALLMAHSRPMVAESEAECSWALWRSAAAVRSLADTSVSCASSAVSSAWRRMHAACNRLRAKMPTRPSGGGGGVGGGGGGAEADDL